MEFYYDPNVRILIMRRLVLRNWHYDNLKVSFWRLYWHSTPGAMLRYQSQTIALTPERIVLVPPNTVIVQRLAHSPVTHFAVHFLTNPPFDRLPSKIYVFKAETCLLAAIKNLPTDEKDFLINNLNLTLAVRGLIHYLLSKIPTTELPPMKISSRLAENMAFVEAHIQKSVSNSEIARHMRVSVNTMFRQYRRELGMTPQAYLRQKRIEKACALLYDPERSVKQIAEETGFCDRYHFSRLFKSIQRLTPRNYRRQLA